ncbi:MAG: hypothetical protein AAF364_03220 [Pseudomonadota bacterium]
MNSKLVPSYFITAIGFIFLVWKLIEIYNYPDRTSLVTVKGDLSFINIDSSEPEVSLQGNGAVYYLPAGLKSNVITTFRKLTTDSISPTILAVKKDPTIIAKDGVSYYLIYEIAIGNELLSYKDIKETSLKISYKGLFFGAILFVSGLVLRKYLLKKVN